MNIYCFLTLPMGMLMKSKFSQAATRMINVMTYAQEGGNGFMISIPLMTPIIDTYD